MGVIAWIVLALLGYVVARQLAGSREPHLPLITAVIAKIPPTRAGTAGSSSPSPDAWDTR